MPKYFPYLPTKIPEVAFKRFVRIGHAILQVSHLTPKEQDTLATVLTYSLPDTAPEIKLKIYQLLKRLVSRRKKPFGMLIVLGWQRDWDKDFAAIPDNTQNIFKDKAFDFAHSTDEKALEKLSEISDFDGAILINSRGEAIASGVYLEKMAPKKVAELSAPGRAEDLSAAFGFVKKVHTRHLSAIAASYWLKGATVFVVSEEDRSIRTMESGRIIYSTIAKEIPAYHT